VKYTGNGKDKTIADSNDPSIAEKEEDGKDEKKEILTALMRLNKPIVYVNALPPITSN